MKTAVFFGERDIQLFETALPEVPCNKIMLKVVTCAICTWEQRVYTGVKKVEFPFIGGHEIAGEVVKIGNEVVGDWKVGDKVVLGTNLTCGYCYWCQSGVEQNCENFNHSLQQPGLPYHGMGGFSEYLLVDPKTVFKYSNVEPKEAALIEPLSCVVHSVEAAEVELGDYVLIIGAGIMGLMHLLLVQKKGAIPIVSDPDKERLAFAQELGAKFVIDPLEEDLHKKVIEYTEGQAAQVIFNTTPKADLIPDLLESLSSIGTLVLYSSYYPDLTVNMTFDRMHKTGQKILGTANSNKRDFLRAARLVSQGIIDVKPFITKVYALTEVKTAFHEATTSSAYRIVIDFSDG